MKQMNYSVKELLRIADKYGYKVGIYKSRNGLNKCFKVFANAPFFKSPYPNTIYSVFVTENYLNSLGLN